MNNKPLAIKTLCEFPPACSSHLLTQRGKRCTCNEIAHGLTGVLVASVCSRTEQVVRCSEGESVRVWVPV